MNVISRELRLYKRSGTWIIGILTPFILVLCLGFTITGTVTDVPVGLSTSDSVLSNQISQIFNNDSSINLKSVNSDNVNTELASGQLRAVISVDSVQNKNVSISILVDSTDTAIKEQVQYSLTSVLYQNLNKVGYSVTINTQELYSGKSFFSYLMPSILVLGPVMGGLFGATDSILNEKEDMTLENVIVAGFSPIKFTLQKIVSYFLTTAITLVLTFTLSIVLSGSIPTLSQIIISLIFIFLSAFIFIALGVGLSTFIPNKEIAGTIGGTIMFPILFISGAFLSVYSMIGFIIPVAKLNPLTICTEALRTILLKNGTIYEVSMNFLTLAVIALALFSFAVYRMNKIINAMQE